MEFFSFSFCNLYPEKSFMISLELILSQASLNTDLLFYCKLWELVYGLDRNLRVRGDVCFSIL